MYILCRTFDANFSLALGASDISYPTRAAFGRNRGGFLARSSSLNLVSTADPNKPDASQSGASHVRSTYPPDTGPIISCCILPNMHTNC